MLHFPQRLYDYICDTFDVEPYMLKRNDDRLISSIERFNPMLIKIIEIPDDVDWEVNYSPIEGIYNTNGREWVAEKHRTWF